MPLFTQCLNTNTSGFYMAHKTVSWFVYGTFLNGYILAPNVKLNGVMRYREYTVGLNSGINRKYV